MTDQPFVLIVEDQEPLAALIAKTMGQISVQTHITLNGEDALAYLGDEAHPLPDLIILDISMPGMSGWEVLDVLKQYETTKQIPVIVATAHSDAANRLVGKLRDVDRYLVKPYQPGDLREAVKDVLGLA